jgi:hypothetical protein
MSRNNVNIYDFIITKKTDGEYDVKLTLYLPQHIEDVKMPGTFLNDIDALVTNNINRIVQVRSAEDVADAKQKAQAALERIQPALDKLQLDKVEGEPVQLKTMREAFREVNERPARQRTEMDEEKRQRNRIYMREYMRKYNAKRKRG